MTPDDQPAAAAGLHERRGKLAGQEHVPPGLLRLSVGCEHIDDLWPDLDSALDRASRP